MKLEEIIQEQVKRSEIDTISPDENGIYHLIINEKHVVMLEPSLDDKGFFLYSVIGTVADDDNQILAEILSEGLFDETSKTSIGIDRDTNSLVLWQHFNYENTDFETFNHELESFIPIFEYWNEKVSKHIIPEQHIKSLQDQKLNLSHDKKMEIFLA